MVAGFLNQSSGSLTLGDNEIKAPGVERGMVFQQGALFECLPVSKNVDFGLRMKKEILPKVRHWLKNGWILWG